MTEEITEFKVKHTNFTFIKPTDRCIIVGAAGQGKTVSAFNIIDMLHVKGWKVNWLCPIKAFRLKKEGKIPEWFTLIHMKYIKFEAGAMSLYDDAAVGSNIREWYTKRNINFNKLLVTARHRKSGIIITTQETNDIDSKILPKCNYVIFKKPGRFAAAMERPAVRKISEKVRADFETSVESKGLNPQEYAFVISDTWEGWVGPIHPPEWFSPEIGDW